MKLPLKPRRDNDIVDANESYVLYVQPGFISQRELVCRAVNCHADLVEALDRLIFAARAGKDDICFEPAISQARTALAKAEVTP